jgi:hypothetical protein
MTTRTTTRPWDERKTVERRAVEEAIRKQFPDTEAYRFNPASIRVRVIDDRLRGESKASERK